MDGADVKTWYLRGDPSMGGEDRLMPGDRALTGFGEQNDTKDESGYVAFPFAAWRTIWEN